MLIRSIVTSHFSTVNVFMTTGTTIFFFPDRRPFLCQHDRYSTVKLILIYQTVKLRIPLYICWKN